MYSEPTSRDGQVPLAIVTESLPLQRSLFYRAGAECFGISDSTTYLTVTPKCKWLVQAAVQG